MCLQKFKNKKIVFSHHAAVFNPALEIGITSLPEQLPIPTTLLDKSTVGILITHSLFFLIISKLWLEPAMIQPKSEGVNSIIVCQPIVIMLDSPFHVELTSTIGPGSRNRLICEVGKSFFL